MPSTSERRLQTFRSDAALGYGVAVKIGSDSQHVALVTAATDKAIGITQNTTDAAEQAMEVALPGGGAKARAGGTIAAGDELGFDASTGKMVKVASASDRVIAIAMESAVDGDYFAVEVTAHKAVGTQA